VIKVDPIPSSDFPTLAIRPLNSRLDCSSLEKDYGIIQPNWRKSLSRVLLNLK
jgi:dTDP-4-dehydrorhamnose reductase